MTHYQFSDPVDPAVVETQFHGANQPWLSDEKGHSSDEKDSESSHEVCQPSSTTSLASSHRLQVEQSTNDTANAATAAQLPWDIDIEEYRDVMRATCGDHLLGKKCRTKASCGRLYKICPAYSTGKVSDNPT